MILPQCILMDLDGTLLDSLPGIAFSVREAMHAAGLPEREVDLRALIGPPIRTILSRAVPTDDAHLLDELERHFRASYDSEGWQRTPFFAGAKEALQSMRASGRRLFVVSNKPRHISLRILEREGVLHLFEQIYTRDSAQPAYASKEAMISVLLSEHGLPPAECLMVGDTMEDVDASTANGLRMIFMEHGYGNAPHSETVILRLQSFSGFLPYLAAEDAN